MRGGLESFKSISVRFAVVYLDVLLGSLCSLGHQQCHSAAPKASPCHPAAIHPIDLQGCRHQLVQLRAAHSIVIPTMITQNSGVGRDLTAIPFQPAATGWLSPHHITLYRKCRKPRAVTSSPQGVVALHHQHPKRDIIPIPQCLCCPCRALDLTNHVPGTAVHLLIQLAPGCCRDTHKPLQQTPRCLEPTDAPCPPSSSAMVTSRRVVLPSAAAASWHWRRRAGYSLPVSVCRTLELVMRTARLASRSGTGTASRDLRGGDSVHPHCGHVAPSRVKVCVV